MTQNQSLIKIIPPNRVDGIYPDRSGNVVTKQWVDSQEFDRLKEDASEAKPGVTYVDEQGRLGFVILDSMGEQVFIDMVGPNQFGTLTDDLSNLVTLVGNLEFVQAVDYDSATQELVVTNRDGTEQRISIADLVDIYTGSEGTHIDVDIDDDNVITAVLKPGTVSETELTTALRNKIDGKADASDVYTKTESDGRFATAAQGALADTAYQKPDTGIPKSDLATAVQASLDKADSSATETRVNTLESRVDSLEVLGHYVGSFATKASIPANTSGFANGVTLNDFVTVKADETQGNATTRYIATAIDNTGAITWTYDLTYSTDISGKQDLLNRTIGGDDNATDTVTDTGGNLSVPISVTVAAPSASTTQITGNTSRTLRATFKILIDNIASLFSTKANLASPTFTGTPAAPTAAAGTNTTQIATTAFVKTMGDGKANAIHNHAISDVTNLQTILNDIPDLPDAPILDDDYVLQVRGGVKEWVPLSSAILNEEFFAFTINTGSSNTFAIPTMNAYPYDWIIDWGDGTARETASGTGAVDSNGISHTYTNNGIYRIIIRPNGAMGSWFRAFGFGAVTTGAGTTANKQKLIAINSTLTIAMFAEPNATTVGTYFAYAMFYGCSGLTSLPSNFNLPAGITTVGTYFARQMFYGCSGLTSLPSNFNLPTGITTVGNYFAQQMFFGCSSLVFVLNSTFKFPQGLSQAQVNQSNMFYQTFYNMSAAQGRDASTVIGTLPAPNSARNTFTNSGFTNISSVPANWR